jgi:hypothetical protein
MGRKEQVRCSAEEKWEISARGCEEEQSKRVKQFERMLGRKRLEIEIPKNVRGSGLRRDALPDTRTGESGIADGVGRGDALDQPVEPLLPAVTASFASRSPLRRGDYRRVR